MENEKNIEMQEEVTETVEEATEVKESKIKGIVGKVGSGFKKHWKTVAVGAGALVVGIVLGSKKSETEEDDADYVEFEEVKDSDDSNVDE